MFLYYLQAMKQKLWITLATYLACCIDKELYKAIDYLKSQVEVLVEQQEKQNKRILLTNKQRMRVAAKAKRLSRKMLEQCTVLFTPDTIIGWYNKLRKSLIRLSTWVTGSAKPLLRIFLLKTAMTLNLI